MSSVCALPTQSRPSPDLYILQGRPLVENYLVHSRILPIQATLDPARRQAARLAANGDDDVTGEEQEEYADGRSSAGSLTDGATGWVDGERAHGGGEGGRGVSGGGRGLRVGGRGLSGGGRDVSMGGRDVSVGERGAIMEEKDVSMGGYSKNYDVGLRQGEVGEGWGEEGEWPEETLGQDARVLERALGSTLRDLVRHSWAAPTKPDLAPETLNRMYQRLVGKRNCTRKDTKFDLNGAGCQPPTD